MHCTNQTNNRKSHLLYCSNVWGR